MTEPKEASEIDGVEDVGYYPPTYQRNPRKMAYIAVGLFTLLAMLVILWFVIGILLEPFELKEAEPTITAEQQAFITAEVSYVVDYRTAELQYLYVEFGEVKVKFAPPYPELVVGWVYKIDAWEDAYGYWHIEEVEIIDQ